jgi:transposase-like protein
MKNKIFRYSESFKRKVVEEYELGEGISDLNRKYGIKGSMTITSWIRKYSSKGFRHEVVHIQTAVENNRVKELEKKVDMMEKVIGRMTLEKLKHEAIMEILEETYGDEIKKNIPSGLLEPSKEPNKNIKEE